MCIFHFTDRISERLHLRNTRGKGRQKKSILESVLTDGEFHVKPPLRDYSRKRKAIHDENMEQGDDDDDFVDEVSADVEYTPKKEVSVKGCRVQPRRSTRGHHSRFDEDYVLFTSKKDKIAKTENELEQETEQLNVQNESKEFEKAQGAGILTVSVIEESLVALKTTNDVTADGDHINNGINKDLDDQAKSSDKGTSIENNPEIKVEQKDAEADEVVKNASVGVNTVPNKEEELNEQTQDGLELLEGEQKGIKVETDSTEVRKEVSTADKGSIIVMFEETLDGKYSCVLCEEVFVEESVAIAHFMIHDSSHIKCKNCGTCFESIESLLEHRANCNKNVVDVVEVTEDNKKHEFVCDICHQAFKTSQYLFRHMVIHTDVFKCDKCEKTFSRKDSMQKHVLKCCPELAEKYKIFYCEVCFRVFSKESGRKRHVEKCKSVQCNACGKIFSSQTDMEIHSCKSIDADETAKYSCGRCSKAFQSLYYLKQHQSLHDNNHACNRCGKNFSSPDELVSHTSVCETLENIRLYGSGVCLICKEAFSNSKLFRNHHMTHTHPFHCEKCDKRFMRIGSLNSHECEINSDWVCSVCNKTFRYQANLDKHMKESGCSKYQCSVCNEQFHTKLQAKEHSCIVDAAAEVEAQIVSKVHTKEICPTCGKWFSNKSNLSKHMILHGEKKLACPHCPKKFHLDVYLKEHITCVHFKIFKYQCNECGRLLKSKTGLIAHNRIFHAKNAETFPCTKCGKVFKQKGNLRAHMFSHSTERRFKCELCSRAFKYPDQLSRHKIEHKLMPKLKCDHCEKEFLRSYDLKKHLQVYHSGYIYICGVCAARCGHRHTLVRHYKRKHPESVHLTRQEGYLDGLLKHVDELYDADPDIQNSILANRKYKMEKVAADVENVDEIMENSEMLPEDAAEALHSLALGQATAKQFQLLKDKGLFIQTEPGMIREQDKGLLVEQTPVVVPQDSYIFGGQGLEHGQMIETTEEVATSSTEGIGEIGLVQNPDGSLSINEVHGIPQTIENGEAQIVILQIVNPGTQLKQGEIILNQDQVLASSGEILANAGQVVSDGGEILPQSQIQTILIENAVNQVSSSVDLHVSGLETVSQSEETVSETNNASVISDSMHVDNGIKLDDGDPNIQAPMVYSQDVSCTE